MSDTKVREPIPNCTFTFPWGALFPIGFEHAETSIIIAIIRAAVMCALANTLPGTLFFLLFLISKLPLSSRGMQKSYSLSIFASPLVYSILSFFFLTFCYCEIVGDRPCTATISGKPNNIQPVQTGG